MEVLEGIELEEPQPLSEHSGGIVLEDADIWDPDGIKPIAIRLTLSLPSDGIGLAICGPSGVGTGTVARTLCGLLPTEVGVVRLPPPRALHLLPSQPHLPCGTLTDVVTYPERLALELTSKDCTTHPGMQSRLPTFR